MAFWLSARRWWEQEQKRLAEGYPRVEWIEDRRRNLLSCWLVATPFPPDRELRLVIADLDARRIVDVGQNGQLQHHTACDAPHSISKLCFEPVCLHVDPREVQVRLDVPPPPAWPRLYCLDPLITRARFPRFPHFMGDSAACAMYSADQAWDSARGDGPLEYLDLGMIWVFKALLWIATMNRSGAGEWLGPDATGDPRDDLEDIRPSDSCLCGSGLPFARCCRTRIAQRAALLDEHHLPRGTRGVFLG